MLEDGEQIVFTVDTTAYLLFGTYHAKGDLLLTPDGDEYSFEDVDSIQKITEISLGLLPTGKFLEEIRFKDFEKE